jgi:hypothetical protein
MPRTHQAGARPDSGTALRRNFIAIPSPSPPFTSIRAVLDAFKQQYPIVPEIHFDALIDAHGILAGILGHAAEIARVVRLGRNRSRVSLQT